MTVAIEGCYPSLSLINDYATGKLTLTRPLSHQRGNEWQCGIYDAHFVWPIREKGSSHRGYNWTTGLLVATTLQFAHILQFYPSVASAMFYPYYPQYIPNVLERTDAVSFPQG